VTRRKRYASIALSRPIACRELTWERHERRPRTKLSGRSSRAFHQRAVTVAIFGSWHLLRAAPRGDRMHGALPALSGDDQSFARAHCDNPSYCEPPARLRWESLDGS